MAAIRPVTVRPTPLADLVVGLGLSGDTGDTSLIRDITLDSRDVRPGSLWVALPGSRGHGATFAGIAATAGVAGILTDPQGASLITTDNTPVCISRDLRADMGRIAARIFGHPDQHLLTLGVTGTNGKTTTVALLEAALATAGHSVGTIGTLGFRLGGAELPSLRGTVTTPEAPDLQALLAVMLEGGADAVALEVSSHALVLERVSGMVLDVAGFLNLGSDHLDFHGDMDSYFEAKASLFTPEHTKAAVCWVDDDHGARIAGRARESGVRVVTVGTGPDADHRLADWESVPPMGGRATLQHGGRTVDLCISLPGFHNMIDAAVAVVMAETVGIPVEEALVGLRGAQVPGRMQLLDLPPGAPAVVIDFAHTPQAVAASLDALRQSFDTVITVLGCGGDRDREKRPLMGRAASQRSDLLVVTDDNPRTEDPASIRAAMLEGARPAGGNVEEVPGRRAAIVHALGRATAGTVVAILGKGHERGQQIGHELVDFDDAVEARRAWADDSEGTTR